jgi:hypothetical protein
MDRIKPRNVFLMHHVVTLKISKTNENSTQAAHENGYVVTEVKF